MSLIFERVVATAFLWVWSIYTYLIISKNGPAIFAGLGIFKQFTYAWIIPGNYYIQNNDNKPFVVVNVYGWSQNLAHTSTHAFEARKYRSVNNDDDDDYSALGVRQSHDLSVNWSTRVRACAHAIKAFLQASKRYVREFAKLRVCLHWTNCSDVIRHMMMTMII